MFNDVKVGDELVIYFPKMRFQKQPSYTPAKVVEVKDKTFVVSYLADGYRKSEFQKSDGKSIHNTEDIADGYPDAHGWIQRK